jgi:putative transposase
LAATRHQLILGNDNFIASFQPFVDARVGRDTPKAQRRAAALSLTEYEASALNMRDAMAAAYRSTACTMEEIADYFQVSAHTVSRAISERES